MWPKYAVTTPLDAKTKAIVRLDLDLDLEHLDLDLDLVLDLDCAKSRLRTAVNGL